MTCFKVNGQRDKGQWLLLVFRGRPPSSPVEQHWPGWHSLADPGGVETFGVFGDLSLFGGEPFGCTLNLSFPRQRLAAWHLLQMNQSSVLGAFLFVYPEPAGRRPDLSVPWGLSLSSSGCDRTVPSASDVGPPLPSPILRPPPLPVS